MLTTIISKVIKNTNSWEIANKVMIHATRTICVSKLRKAHFKKRWMMIWAWLMNSIRSWVRVEISIEFANRFCHAKSKMKTSIWIRRVNAMKMMQLLFRRKAFMLILLLMRGTNPAGISSKRAILNLIFSMTENRECAMCSNHLATRNLTRFLTDNLTIKWIK